MQTKELPVLHALKDKLFPPAKTSYLALGLLYGGLTILERVLASGGKTEKEMYETNIQPPWNPPAWIFAPAWIFNNLVLLYGTKRLMDKPDNYPGKKPILALQALIWGVYTTFNYVYTTRKSPVLAAVWTQADMLFALSSLLRSLKGNDRKITASFVPLTLWTAFASSLAWYQALYNPDDLLKTEAPLELAV